MDYLAKDHYIIHSGGIVYVDGENSNQPAGFSENTTLVSDTVELLNNKVVFEITLPTNNYRVEKMSLYADEETFTLTTPERVGDLGETKVTDKKFGLNLFTKQIDDTYNSHEIKITKEIDRLVVSGRFKRENKVNVILYQNVSYLYYNVRVSKKPYTALCVDIFTEEETENGIVVTQYINEKRLKGRYQVLIEIDGTIYNTERYVEF